MEGRPKWTEKLREEEHRDSEKNGEVETQKGKGNKQKTSTKQNHPR